MVPFKTICSIHLEQHLLIFSLDFIAPSSCFKRCLLKKFRFFGFFIDRLVCKLNLHLTHSSVSVYDKWKLCENKLTKMLNICWRYTFNLFPLRSVSFAQFFSQIVFNSMKNWNHKSYTTDIEYWEWRLIL